eukprot:SM000079S22501  [mRNA]  locus=s79:579888:582546:- [translate_table: standard]
MGKGADRDGAVTVCGVLLAILLPPLGVFVKRECHIEFWICVLLTILGYIPGIIYALYFGAQVGIGEKQHSDIASSGIKQTVTGPAPSATSAISSDLAEH